MARRGDDDRRRRQAGAGELVEGVLRQAGVAGAVREHRLVTRWSEIVGERVAARAWPSGLRREVLYVRVANSAWMHELGFLKEAIAGAANALVGDPPLVKEVRFHLGGKGEPESDPDDVVAALARQRRPKPPAKKPRPPADAEAVARIGAETDKVADPELKELVRALRLRLGM